MIRFESEGIDENEFLKWKNGLSLAATKGANGNSLSVIEALKNFDIATKTPMECAIFLAEMKKLAIR